MRTGEASRQSVLGELERQGGQCSWNRVSEGRAQEARTECLGDGRSGRTPQPWSRPAVSDARSLWEVLGRKDGI